MSVWRITLLGTLLFSCGGLAKASDTGPICIPMNKRPELYSLIISPYSLIFVENVETYINRDEIFIDFILRNGFFPPKKFHIFSWRFTMDMDEHSAPAYPWTEDTGYSLWVDERYVCEKDKPTVYNLSRDRYREPFI